VVVDLHDYLAFLSFAYCLRLMVLGTYFKVCRTEERLRPVVMEIEML
jgi:hypothetical protein